MNVSGSVPISCLGFLGEQYGILQRQQETLYLLPLRFQPGGKPKACSQCIRSLIGGESGRVGGDLEQHPARLAEVDGVKVLSVHDGTDVVPLAYQPPAPL